MNNIPHIYLCTVDGHLGSFQYLAFTNNAAMTSLTGLWYTYACISDGGIQRSDCWVVGACVLSFESYRQSYCIPILA